MVACSAAGMRKRGGSPANLEETGSEQSMTGGGGWPDRCQCHVGPDYEQQTRAVYRRRYCCFRIRCHARMNVLDVVDLFPFEN
jgi:hypothetical protein